MYEVDSKDRVVQLPDLPQSSVGAPCPIVLSDEHSTVLAYYLQETPEGWDGTSVRVVGPGSSDEPLAIVRLTDCYATMFGPPNDEAFEGHPLAERGLEPYSAFRVESSSWIRQLARMNSIHPYHSDSAFERYQHLVFAFHDSTFEAVCGSFEISRGHGSITSVVPRMVELLDLSGG